MTLRLKEKKEAGQLINTLKGEVEEKITARAEALKSEAFAPASDASGAELKVAQKLKALELLGKHLGLCEGVGARQLPKVEIREDIGNS